MKKIDIKKRYLIWKEKKEGQLSNIEIADIYGVSESQVIKSYQRVERLIREYKKTRKEAERKKD